ncbi:hypothetical protein GCM10023187_42600 [Nibrella viscosa]|uniref:Por secretion system C-terminal sorting domain-containing protein n=1 Tax=Nibrella viscosa TaxID=1084524 RepID=A0ABP8KRI5_9BACT
MRFYFLTPKITGFFLSLVLGLTATAPAWSQSPINYLDPTQPNRGYWKLYTDHATRNTIIRLYNSGNELVYEEIMPGQYIKLTERTVSRINETLELVAANKLILSKVKVYDLTDGYQAPEPVTEKPEGSPTTASATVHTDYAMVQVNANILKKTNSLLVQCDNPEKRRLKISLRNSNGQVVFTHSMNSEKYAQQFDLTGLQPGTYRLSVDSPYRHYPFLYTRQVTVDKGTLTVN